MQEIQYKNFSLITHKKNWDLNRPNVCQFELTFGCGLHCRHCSTDCYNNSTCVKKELDTKEVKLILDKARNEGIIWVCFTGGDPLVRADFLDIYSYAKVKGFLITIFTNGFSMTKEIAQCLKKMPPFAIEMTLNAAKKESYDKISQVKDSFDSVVQGINLMLKVKSPLKIKTQITKDNLEEVPQIEKFVKSLGLKFNPNIKLHARLNGDLAPCNLRISQQDIIDLAGNRRLPENDCRIVSDKGGARNKKTNNLLFRCAVSGGDGIYVDPYGNMFLCNLIRKPAFNLVKTDIKYALKRLLPFAKGTKLSNGSKCRKCELMEFCHNCPGEAYLETGDMGAPVEYYCGLAQKLKIYNIYKRKITLNE